MRLRVLLVIRESLIAVVFMHVDLHWLDVPERVKFKLVSMVHNCFHHKAPSPRWLMDYCIPISDVASRRYLHSVRRQYVVLPRHSLSSYRRRAGICCRQTNCLELTEQFQTPA